MFDDGKEIAKTLVDYIQTKVIINPLFPENALIKIHHERMEEIIASPSKWQEIGKFHLLFKKWNKFRHSQPLVVKGYGLDLC